MLLCFKEFSVLKLFFFLFKKLIRKQGSNSLTEEELLNALTIRGFDLAQKEYTHLLNKDNMKQLLDAWLNFSGTVRSSSLFIVAQCLTYGLLEPVANPPFALTRVFRRMAYKV